MSGRGRPARWPLLVAAALLGAHAVALLAARADAAGPLWRDEAGAVAVATLPAWSEVHARFPHEAFPLLFLAVVRGVVALPGEDEDALRGYGAAVGVALLAACWRNARAAGGVPLVSLSLLAPHAALLVVVAAVRGYGLGALLVVLALGAFAAFVERGGWRSALAAGAATVAAVHTVLHAVPLVAALALAAAATAALARQWWRAAVPLAIALGAALSLLPYHRPIGAAMGWQKLIVDPLPITPARVWRAGEEILATGGEWVPAVWLGLAVTVWGAALWGQRRRGDGTDDPVAPATRFRLFAVPLALGCQLLFFAAVGYLPRGWYFVPLLALLASALDGLVAPLLRGRAACAAAAAVALLLGLGLAPTAWHAARQRATNVDLVAAEVERRARPGDLVLVQPWFYGVSFHRYYRSGARWMTVPALGDLRFHRYDLLAERMAQAAPLAEVRAAARQALRGGHRVWWVGPYQPPPGGRALQRLPPAPAGPYGWADAPYVAAWGEELASWLRDRAVTTRQVTGPRAGVSGLENLPLQSFAGWRRRVRPDQSPSG